MRVVLYLLMSFRSCDCYPNTKLGVWWCSHWRFLYLRCQDRREISFGRGLHFIFFILSWGGIFIMGVYITENIKNMTPLQYPLMKHITCIPSACLAFRFEVVANLLRYAPSVAVNQLISLLLYHVLLLNSLYTAYFTGMLLSCSDSIFSLIACRSAVSLKPVSFIFFAPSTL